jgi:hypothetical protein
VSALVLDSGALIGVDRNDRSVVSLLAAASQAGMSLRTSANVVAQVWRDDRGRQAHLARLLRSVDVRPVDDSEARAIGVLLSITGTSDVVDASVVLVSRHGDELFTSDPDDVVRLLQASGRRVRVHAC